MLPNDLYIKLAKDIQLLGKEKAGAVVGATQTAQLKTMRDLMPDALFLVPGIGAQGGSVKDVADHAKITSDNAGFLINSSRGIIFADHSENFAEAAYQASDELRKEINQYL